MRPASSSRARSGPRRPRARGHEAASGPRPVACAVVTVSDSRRAAADTAGARIEAMLTGAGHRVLTRAWVSDDPHAIRRAVRAALARSGTDVVILTGGTGLSPRDRTPEALTPLVQKWLPGFGELLRARSVAQVGAAAWMSRTGAGVAHGRLVVMLPGSRAAVELALEQVLLPELSHAVRLLGRFAEE
ncbi:MAG TPA: molybdenum cofactor biosynthesis protein B [Candidatus Eisenbacteria bacterium]|nr:molybdenum cofactor biosynthesis protein B [Candidatus Eisenbacteria bacterium]